MRINKNIKSRFSAKYFCFLLGSLILALIAYYLLNRVTQIIFIPSLTKTFVTLGIFLNTNKSWVSGIVSKGKYFFRYLRINIQTKIHLAADIKIC